MTTADMPLGYHAPLRPGEIRKERAAHGIVITVGPRTAGQVVAAMQWSMFALAALALGCLVVAGTLAARAWSQQTLSEDETGQLLTYALGGSFLLWMVWVYCRILARPLILTVTPDRIGVERKNTWNGSVWTSREWVTAVRVEPLRRWPFARDARVLRIELSAGPPLFVAAGHTAAVVVRLAAMLEAAMAEVPRGATGYAPPPVGPPVPIPYEQMAPVPAEPVRALLPPAGDELSYDVPLGPGEVRMDAGPRETRVVVGPLTGRQLLVSLAWHLTVFLVLTGGTALVSSSLLILVAERGASDDILGTAMFTAAGLGVSLWSLFLLLNSARHRRGPAEFVISNEWVDAPEDRTFSHRLRVPRSRVTAASAGERRFLISGARANALLLQLDGRFSCYLLRGYPAAAVARAAEKVALALERHPPASQGKGAASAAAIPEPDGRA